jgi:hypothetical protein
MLDEKRAEIFAKNGLSSDPNQPSGNIKTNGLKRRFALVEAT